MEEIITQIKFKKRFIENFKRRREELNLNKLQLSKISRMPRSIIYSIEHRKCYPSIWSIYRFAQALEVSPAYFFEDHGEYIPKKRKKKKAKKSKSELFNKEKNQNGIQDWEQSQNNGQGN